LVFAGEPVGLIIYVTPLTQEKKKERKKEKLPTPGYPA
jgi:hypothetical protein